MAYIVEKGDIQFKLGMASHMATTYQERISQTGSLTAQKDEIKQKIQATKAKIQDLQTATETYERDFVDRRQVPLSKKGTLQDVVLGVFFAGYLLLGIGAIAFVFMSYAPKALNISTNNPVLRYSMTFFTLFIVIVFGVLMAELVRRYA
jgi:hypothetical protein